MLSTFLHALLQANDNALGNLTPHCINILPVNDLFGKAKGGADDIPIHKEKGRLERCAGVRRRQRRDKDGGIAGRIHLVVDRPGREDGALVSLKSLHDFARAVARADETGNERAGREGSLGDDEGLDLGVRVGNKETIAKALSVRRRLCLLVSWLLQKVGKN